MERPPAPLTTVIASSPHRPRRLPLLLLLALLACLGAATPARADDDPAGTALAYQDVYVPVGAPLPAGVIRGLQELAAAARRAHHPVKVALIASPADLDVLGRFFGRPSAYARLLGRELSYAFSGDVLVAMPNGLGMFDHAAAGTARDAVAGIRVDRRAGATGLAAAAAIALRRLASGANGSVASPSHGTQVTLAGAGALAGALAVVLVLRVRRRARGVKLFAPRTGVW